VNINHLWNVLPSNLVHQCLALWRNPPPQFSGQKIKPRVDGEVKLQTTVVCSSILSLFFHHEDGSSIFFQYAGE
jgi:hypothetical protein